MHPSLNIFLLLFICFIRNTYSQCTPEVCIDKCCVNDICVDDILQCSLKPNEEFTPLITILIIIFIFTLGIPLFLIFLDAFITRNFLFLPFSLYEIVANYCCCCWCKKHKPQKFKINEKQNMMNHNNITAGN